MKIFIIAIVFIMITVALFFLLGNRNSVSYKVSLEDIESKYLKPWPLPDHWDETPGFRTRDVAFHSYSQHDYSEARVNFKYAIVDNPDDNTVRFYLGVCELLTGEALGSIREFNLLLRDEKNEYVEPSKFYKSIALLKLDRNSQARRLLKSTNLPQARELLKDLN